MRLDSRPTLFLLAHLGLVALLAQVAQAQEAGTRPAPKPTSVLEKSVVEAINTGANLFNNEDFAGCYRLYQGALIAYAPVIDGLPDVKKKVEAYHRESLLARTEGDKAIILRKALDEILVASQKSATEAAIHATTPSTKPSTTSPTKPEMPGRPLTRPGIPTEPAPKPAAVQSLWVRLGGIDSIKPIVSEFIRLSITDPKIDFSRNGKYPLDKVSKSNLELLMIQYFSQVAGGNETYTGRPMLDSHRGMKITDAQFNLMMIHLVDVLRAQKIPQAEASELVSLVNASRKEIVEVKTTESAPAPTTTTPAAPSNIKPLWDRLGGEKSVTLIVHNLVERSSNNPNVDFTRGGKYPLNATTLPRIERQIVEYISSKTGGPLKYTGRDLKKAHQGMGVTENQFDSMNGDLVLVMRKLNIAQEVIDELVGQIGTTFDEIVEKK